MKTDSLSARYETVNQNHAERFSALEQAQVLVARFWETHEELEPWLGETETLIAQLPLPAIDTEALRQQQEQMRVSGLCADEGLESLLLLCGYRHGLRRSKLTHDMFHMFFCLASERVHL